MILVSLALLILLWHTKKLVKLIGNPRKSKLDQYKSSHGLKSKKAKYNANNHKDKCKDTLPLDYRIASKTLDRGLEDNSFSAF